VNNRHMWFQERTDLVGSPRRQVLVDDNKQTDR
jgi:hypothetical protein